MPAALWMVNILINTFCRHFTRMSPTPSLGSKWKYLKFKKSNKQFLSYSKTDKGDYYGPLPLKSGFKMNPWVKSILDETIQLLDCSSIVLQSEES